MPKNLTTKFTEQYARKNDGRGREITCPYNVMVDCYEGEKVNCPICGWNPRVALIRKALQRERVGVK